MLFTSSTLVKSVERYVEQLDEEQMRELLEDLLCDHYNNPKNHDDAVALIEFWGD